MGKAAALCIPADMMIVLFDPTHKEAVTVAAFALVTMCFGLFQTHYVRLAARREDAELIQTDPQAALERLEAAADGHHHVNPGGPIGALRDYRPPMKLQAFRMSLAFTRSFVAFTLVRSFVRKQQ